MGVFVTNAGNLAAAKRILAGKTEERFRQAADTEKRRMLFLARSFSSGRLTRADMRRLGHPYAVRLPVNSAPEPDFIVNVQRGRFAGSWKGRVQRTRQGWTITIYNTSPEAAFLQGGPKSRMRARLICQEILRRTQPDMSRETRKVISRAIQENSKVLPITSSVGDVSRSGTAGVGTGSPLGALVYSVTVGAATVAGGIESAF